MRGVVVFLILMSSVLRAQDFDHIEEISRFEKKSNSLIDWNTSSYRGSFDVVKQVLSLEADPRVQYIRGLVTTTFVVKQPLDEIQLDFSDSLVVDSIYLGVNRLYGFERKNHLLDIKLPAILQPGTSASLLVFYQGKPVADRSFVTDTSKNGKPVMWTLSEPYGAKDWWPCKQDLQDKIDTLEFFLKVPKGFKAVANGVFQSSFAVDSHLVFHYRHSYPIVSYLVAFAVADYAYFEETLALKKGDLKFINYVYKEDSLTAWNDLRTFDKTINLFEDLFGPYPFRREHYGHAQFGWGGGMEHQTLSFMYHFQHGLVAHELAHQWFGDKITCASWQHLWLNEGFATYLDGLTYNFLFPPDRWTGWKQENIKIITQKHDGSVFIPDTSDRARMFDHQLTYRKGAYLLHMLRGQMGDTSFFKAIQSYLMDEKLAYGFASTDDLIWHLKKTAPANFNLDEFFNDWFYKQGWPKYRVQYYQDEKHKVYVVLGQEQSYVWEGTFFDMKVPIQLVTDQSDTTVWLTHTFDGQQYEIQLNHELRFFAFDPELWLLSGNNEVSRVDYHHATNSYKLAPNPAKDKVRVYYSNTILPGVSVEIYDLSGKLAWSRKVNLGLGSDHFDLPLADLRAGTYVVSIKDYYSTTTLRLVKGQ